HHRQAWDRGRIWTDWPSSRAGRSWGSSGESAARVRDSAAKGECLLAADARLPCRNRKAAGKARCGLRRLREKPALGLWANLGPALRARMRAGLTGGGGKARQARNRVLAKKAGRGPACLILRFSVQCRECLMRLTSSWSALTD